MTFTPQDLVTREIHYCATSLVATLAASAGDHDSYQAQELAAPVDDWEETATQAGFEIRHDIHGFYACTLDEAAHEDEGNASVGFDGRPHSSTVEDAARDLCERENTEPYQWEVYEHWIVSDWLAEKLEAKGAKVDRDFAGLTIWARTTTGQAIHADSVSIAICDDLNRAA